MVARRQQTTPSSQSVGFYKFVALTFLGITLILFGVIVFMSSKRAVITITTRSEPVDVTTTVSVNDDTARSVTGTVVTTTVSSTASFEPTGDRQEPGLAGGTVTLHNETTAPQPLVATTRLLSPDGILFRLESGVTVPANGTVQATVYADQEGATGDIAPTKFTIPGLAEAKQADIYAMSDEAMTGGVRTIGAVSSEDIEKAKKIMLERLKAEASDNLTNDTEGLVAVYDVVASELTTDVEIGTEISQFTVSGDVVIAGIFYSAEDVAQLGRSVLMSRAIDDAEYIEPSDAAPVVSLGSYDAANNTAALDVTYTGRASINPESQQLDKAVFFGKTKDEVRRYLLSLDHVYGVDVHLRPAWTQTIPHVGEHVDIVVKQVE